MEKDFDRGALRFLARGNEKARACQQNIEASESLGHVDDGVIMSLLP